MPAYDEHFSEGMAALDGRPTSGTSDQGVEEGMIPQNALNAMIHGIGEEILRDTTNWFGKRHATSLTELAMGLAAESGEALDEVRRLMRDEASINDLERRSKLVKELMDVWYYYAPIIFILQIDLEQNYQLLREQNTERYAK